LLTRRKLLLSVRRLCSVGISADKFLAISRARAIRAFCGACGAAPPRRAFALTQPSGPTGPALARTCVSACVRACVCVYMLCTRERAQQVVFASTARRRCCRRIL